MKAKKATPDPDLCIIETLIGKHAWSMDGIQCNCGLRGRVLHLKT